MVESEIVDGVCLLTLNVPPLNTITLELLSELRESIQRASEDATVRGIVITGDAAHFSAGADVNLFQQIASTRRCRTIMPDLPDGVPRDRGLRQAGGRRADRQVIGGALELATGVPLSRRWQQQPVQHARGQSGHQSRRWRDAAAAEAGRAGGGSEDVVDGRNGRCRSGPLPWD